MAAAPVRPTAAPAGPVIAVALAAALLVGVAVAVAPAAGVALAAGVCFGALALINLGVAIALWVPLAFVQDISLPLPVGAAAGIVLVLAWLGTLRYAAAPARDFVAVHHRLLGGLAVLLVWLSLTALWASDLGRYGAEIWNWFAVALAFIVVGTAICTRRHVRLLAGAFVLGALLSAAAGVLEPASSELEGRLYGGSGDPNYSAAGFLAGIIVACGLLGGSRRPEARVLLVAAIAALAAALAATQSRGAIVGAVAATLAALVVYRGRRWQVLAIAATGASMLALFFAVSPSGFERLTSAGEDESRTELWLVASRMAEDHPLEGVGLNNFRAESADYVREPGELRFVELIADRPLVVHNAFLQLLAETGIVGLVLFTVFVLGCLRAAALAAARFTASRREDLASLARAVAVAIVAMLATSLFLSNATDRRLWVLLALGPALLAMARRDAAGRRPA